MKCVLVWVPAIALLCSNVTYVFKQPTWNLLFHRPRFAHFNFQIDVWLVEIALDEQLGDEFRCVRQCLKELVILPVAGFLGVSRTDQLD